MPIVSGPLVPRNNSSSEVRGYQFQGETSASKGHQPIIPSATCPAARSPNGHHPHSHDSGAQQCHNAHVQSHAARRRRRLAIALVVSGLVMLLSPVLASAIAPGLAWVAWLARSLPAALVLAGVLVWYRADKVFDRGFEPDETPDFESHDSDR